MKSTVLWASVTAALAVLVLLPLGWLVVKSFQTEAGLSLANYAAIGSQKAFRAATVNSLVFGVAASLIGLVLGAPMAWAVSRTNMPLRGLVRAGVLGAFVTPGFVLAVAWILLAGPNAGLLNKLWIALTGASRGMLDVYTMTGLVLVSVASTFPLAFILVYNTLELMSGDVEEAARVLGAGTARVTWTITLPLALPAIVASLILMFLETIILYGVPAMIGVPARIYVLTTQLFSLFEWPPRIGLAAAISLPLLLVTAVLLFDRDRPRARRDRGQRRCRDRGRRRLPHGAPDRAARGAARIPRHGAAGDSRDGLRGRPLRRVQPTAPRALRHALDPDARVPHEVPALRLHELPRRRAGRLSRARARGQRARRLARPRAPRHHGADDQGRAPRRMDPRLHSRHQGAEQLDPALHGAHHGHRDRHLRPLSASFVGRGRGALDHPARFERGGDRGR